MDPLQQLPSPSEKRLAVRVKAAAQRQIRAGHPWVFDGSVESVSHDGSPGDLAVIFDKSRDFLAIGLYDPDSPIRIRILHHGKPVPIDADFWVTRLVEAVDRRSGLMDQGDTTGYRLVNGENDGFPGMVVDQYGSVVVIKLYSAAWFAHLRAIVPIIEGLLECDTVLLRLSRALQSVQGEMLHDGAALVGAVPVDPVFFQEHGLRFEADLVHGQKTGYFLDQRDNRAMVRGLSEGARVLDMFACTGGFSVHAAAGGAVEVLSVDQSAPALAAAKRNMGHNVVVDAVSRCRHETMRGDAFAVMEHLTDRGDHFDVVVIDPPSFAQREASVEGALRSYRRLTTLGVGLVNDGDWLVQASCSSRVSVEQFVETVDDAARAAGASLLDLIVTGHCVDHPVTFREGAYLKAIFARVRR